MGTKVACHMCYVTVMAMITDYAEFWPFYLREHSKAATRALHYIGTTLAFANLIACVVLGEPRFLLVGLVSGYLFAWIGHFFIQKNRPATFTYPLWSLISDFRMCGVWLSGRMASELTRHKIG